MKKTPAATNRTQGNLADDILLTFLITFTYSAYSYEARLSEEIMSVLNHILFLIFILTWIFTAIKNGLNKKTGFAVYSALYWIIPQIVILLFYHGPQIFRHSVFVYTLSEFSFVLTSRPLELVNRYFEVTAEMSALIIMIIIFGAYATGYAYTKNRNIPSQNS